jgi:hypothetical protein
LIFGLIIPSGWSWYCELSAFSQDPPQDEILGWISELGDGQFAVRDRATKQLNRLTIDELPLLVEQLDMATDPEVIVRLSGVVAKLKHERQQKTIRAFLRDPDMKQTHDLSGWTSFSAVAGANRSSKRLFLELFDRYPHLVEQPLDNGQEAFDAAAAVARSIQESMVQLGEGHSVDGLALLYCLCAMDLHGDQRLSSTGLRVFGRFPYHQVIRDPQSKRPIEAMMERWALSLPSSDDWTNAMLIMVESDLSTVSSIARKVLRVRQGPDRADPEDLLVGLQMMFRFGHEEDLPVIEAWLDCTDVCAEAMAMGLQGGFGPVPLGQENPPGRDPAPEQYPLPQDRALSQRTFEVRDAAILACMRITGMEYRNYFPGLRTLEPRGYHPNSALLPAEEKEFRQARIDQWRETRKP